jgi:hypothetical protein
MAGSTGPNDPGGRRPRDKVRQLQRRLCAAAKRASTFYNLGLHRRRGTVRYPEQSFWQKEAA